MKNSKLRLWLVWLTVLLLICSFPMVALGVEDDGGLSPEPAAVSEEPAVSEEETAASNSEPVASEEETAASDEEPIASDEETAANDEEPAASDEEPAASDEEPAVSDENPAASKEPAADEPSIDEPGKSEVEAVETAKEDKTASGGIQKPAKEELTETEQPETEQTEETADLPEIPELPETEETVLDGTETPELEAPEVENPELEDPELEEPEMPEPELPEPELAEPKAPEPEPVYQLPEQPPVYNAVVLDLGGPITVDGQTGDWEAAGVATVNPGSGENDRGVNVTGLRIAKDNAGNVYLCLEGSANIYHPIEHISIYIMQNGRRDALTANDCGYAYICDANGVSEAPFVLEFAVPASYFTDENYVICFNNADFPADAIPLLDDVGQKPVEPEVPTYQGIVIDGDFGDWEAVGKYPAADFNGCIDQTAVVFDGDWVYVYLHETDNGYASGAGTHSNGQFAFTTDLGRTLVFQLTKDGKVNGVAGAEAQHVGHQWEVAIPAGALPYYAQTISFGLYLGDTFVSDVADLQGGGGNAGSFSGIVIDGQYRDWIAYPHEIIEYATPGTHAEVADSEGALYVENNKLYAHVETTMPEHLASRGGDFLAAISVAFNGDRSHKEYPQDGNFYPAMVDKNGNVTIVNEYTRLENGTYTFVICDTRTVEDGADAQVFGTMKLTVNGHKDEMEFEIDLEKVAEYIGASASDFKLIEAQFGRLGQQWLSIAGTSSGAWLGVALCVAVSAGALLIYKRREAAGR